MRHWNSKLLISAGQAGRQPHGKLEPDHDFRIAPSQLAGPIGNFGPSVRATAERRAAKDVVGAAAWHVSLALKQARKERPVGAGLTNRASKQARAIEKLLLRPSRRRRKAAAERTLLGLSFVLF